MWGRSERLGPTKLCKAIWNRYSKIARRQEGCERVVEVFRRQVSKQTHKGRQSTEKGLQKSAWQACNKRAKRGERRVA